jgi:hypothetical protein
MKSKWMTIASLQNCADLRALQAKYLQGIEDGRRGEDVFLWDGILKRGP